jgi:UDP:flavonoid glycosyltransferase YjiC (YdhE family)
MRILICPINWGLGHASRDVPIAHKLHKLGHEVILAGDGAPLQLLQIEFPELEYLYLPPSIRITYFKHLPAWLKIFILSPFLLYEIIAEHLRLKKIIRTVHPDLVISDNRYGLWSSKVRCILITHQCSVKLPVFIKFLEYPATLALKLFIEKFDRCWIPDYPGTENLSGDLAHRLPRPSNAVFIGPVSRFSEPDIQAVRDSSTKYLFMPELSDAALLILLSGPEPQRTRLEKIILKQAPAVPFTTIILQGLPGREEMKEIGPKHILVPHLPATVLRPLIENASYIICRSGYTSIMDLVAMKKRAMVIPTPGQTEQEYLAAYLTEKGLFLSSNQQNFDLLMAVSSLDKFEPTFTFPAEDHLTNLLMDL